MSMTHRQRRGRYFRSRRAAGPESPPAGGGHHGTRYVCRCTAWVDALEKGLAVIVVLNDSVDDETASRFVDFMSGAVYLAHGSIELLNDDVLICLPETVRLDKDRLTDFQGIPAWKGPNL